MCADGDKDQSPLILGLPGGVLGRHTGSPVRPGTDAALAMGLLHVIIGEDIYDHEFVEYWTYGFELLAERVADKNTGMDFGNHRS